MANKYAARKMFDEGVAAYVKKDFKASLDLFSRATLRRQAANLTHDS